MKNQNHRGFKRSQNGNIKNHSRGDSKGCFKCGQEGHFARECKSNNQGKSKFQNEPVSLEFPDYTGQKLHDLPKEVIDEVEVRRPVETDVGISTYLNNNESEVPLSGFSCILKHRYSDFNVNEIDLDGKVTYLTNIDPPKCDAKQSLSEKLESINYPTFKDLPDCVKKWVSPISWSRLLIAAKKYSTPEELAQVPSNTELIRIDVSGSEKEDRKALHNWVKQNLPHLNSDGAKQSTGSDDPNKKYIILTYMKPDKFQSSDSDKWLKVWPRDREERFLHFTLYKEDSDQAELFNRLTKLLIGNRYMNQNSKVDFKNSKYSFKAAGNKDKRARTSQRIAIKHVMAASVKDAVAKLNGFKQKFNQNKDGSKKQEDQVAVGNFEYKHNDIDLGDLKGNRFTIVLRNISSNPIMDAENAPKNGSGDESITTKVDKAMYSLGHKGFINYFGLQRFGNVFFPSTSDVGLAMIKEDWPRVVELILYPRNNERPSMRRARAHWWMYRSAKDAIRLLEHERISSIEGILLKGLSQHHENDLIGALLRLPKHSLLLYMHAYQALVWNKVVSRRIDQFGDKVLVGDIVRMPEGKPGNLLSEDNNDQSTADNSAHESTTDDATGIAEEDTETSEVSQKDINIRSNEKAFLNRLEKKKQQLSYVTEENLEQFQLDDVEMIVPGHGIPYPKNPEIKQMYIDVMKEDGLENGFDDLKNVKDKRFSLVGDYRKMIGKPEDLKYRMIQYSDPNQNLTLSDLDVLKQKEAIQSTPDGNYNALVLEMSLRSSMYATMAIREFTRMDTGKTYQTKLTNQHQKDEGDKTEENADGSKEKTLEDTLNSSETVPKVMKIEEST